jgi:purine-binding chemotaxis protein CheW
MITLSNLLIFQIDEQRYAIAVDPVVQIVPMATIISISQASSIAEGVINVHGKVVPVVDLRRHLGKSRRPLHFHTPIILINIKEHLVGLIVDDVDNVVSLQASQIVHPDEILPEDLYDSTLLIGVAYTPEGVVLVLDPDQFFHPGQLQVLAEAAEFLLEQVKSGKLEE